MCRPPPPPPPPFFPPDSGCLQITVVTSSAASVFRKLCQEVGSLARWMEGDSSGWAARRVRRLSGRLTSSCSWHDRGWLSVSLTAPPVMSVTPGDTGSHVFWAGSQQFEALFIFYLEEEKEVKDILFHPGFYFFPFPIQRRRPQSSSLSPRRSFWQVFSAAREAFMGRRWALTGSNNLQKRCLF